MRLPIAPDTSLALGELLLPESATLNCWTGRERRWLHGFRYYDDYEFFAPTRHQADEVVAAMTRILGHWQLTANPYKIEVKELPMPVEEDGFRSSRHPHAWRFFSGAIRPQRLVRRELPTGERFRRLPVVSYALGRFVGRNMAERRKVQKAGHTLSICYSRPHLGNPAS